MNGMDMGVTAWVTMMAAMMLPGAAPAVAGYARIAGTARAALLFAGVYLAGVVLIAAGDYELTPVKRHFRRRCRENSGSAIEYTLCCAGSSVGLMAALVAVDVMSLFWMAVVTVIATAQKLLSAKAAIDVPLALAIVGFGLVLVIQ
jgi:predicted metal-binding membrane protein